MRNGAREYFWGRRAAPSGPMVLNIRSLTDSGLDVPVNNLTDMSLFGWVKSARSWSLHTAPGWTETSGGWGGTYFGQVNDAEMEVRFGSGSSLSRITYSYVFPTNEWHHYCFVRSSGSYKYYLDGQLRETKTGNTTAMKRNGRFYLTQGFYGSRNTSYDVGIAAYGAFSRALSDSEVAQVYAAGAGIDKTVAPFSSGLILGLNLTEGSGTQIYDVAGERYMTITSGTPQWSIPFNPAISGG